MTRLISVAELSYGGDDQNSRRVHLLNCNQVCSPKKDGGLGLRHAREVNAVFMMKASWNLCTNPTSLWASLVRGKYGCGVNGFPRVNKRKHGSNFWRGVSRNWDNFKQLLVWRLGNGADCKFWADNWLTGIGPLSEKVLDGIAEPMLNQNVSFYVDANGRWAFDKFEHLLPVDFVSRFNSLVAPDLGNMNDTIEWSASPDGSFSSSSAYKALSMIEPNPK